jgi:hypothetical protein
MATHLCGVELEQDAVVHELLQLLVVVVAVLAPALGLHLVQLLLVCELAVDGDVTSVQDENLRVLLGDADISVRDRRALTPLG